MGLKQECKVHFSLISLSIEIINVTEETVIKLENFLSWSHKSKWKKKKQLEIKKKKLMILLTVSMIALYDWCLTLYDPQDNLKYLISPSFSDELVADKYP